MGKHKSQQSGQLELSISYIILRIYGVDRHKEILAIIQLPVEYIVYMEEQIQKRIYYKCRPKNIIYFFVFFFFFILLLNTMKCVTGNSLLLLLLLFLKDNINTFHLFCIIKEYFCPNEKHHASQHPPQKEHEKKTTNFSFE